MSSKKKKMTSIIKRRVIREDRDIAMVLCWFDKWSTGLLILAEFQSVIRLCLRVTEAVFGRLSDCRIILTRNCAFEFRTEQNIPDSLVCAVSKKKGVLMWKHTPI